MSIKSSIIAVKFSTVSLTVVFCGTTTINPTLSEFCNIFFKNNLLTSAGRINSLSVVLVFILLEHSQSTLSLIFKPLGKFMFDAYCELNCSEFSLVKVCKTSTLPLSDGPITITFSLSAFLSK
ncbi:MAG TPA: hypothetical protein LFV90_02925 [Rickettsia endosymbiont of Columbicola hoogstraali]|nr:hypothetical protein [Rickettsia endosymbiont of Columbicola hoogstraali]